MAGDDSVASRGLTHCFNRSVRVITSQLVANAMVIASTAPITMEMLEAASTAHSRRSSPDHLYGMAAVSGAGAGAHGCAPICAPRGVCRVALAFLRQPARTSASSASPAIQAA